MSLSAIETSRANGRAMGADGHVAVACLTAREIAAQSESLARFMRSTGVASLTCDLRWLDILHDSLGHTPYLLQATSAEQTVGILPLALVKSVLFGRYLVGLPYVNSGGVLAASPAVAGALIARAVQLADDLGVRHLELRHENEIAHERLTEVMTTKMHLRLTLPDSSEKLWSQFKPKVRNQVRNGEGRDFDVFWGRHELLPDFYDVFSRNMRDLGTPVYPRRLFREILTAFADRAELCVLRSAGRPVSGALLLHGDGVSEVPSASSLRQFNPTNANMLMYWRLLCRCVELGQRVFDFGRSSEGSGTYRFKVQWGAKPEIAAWQYYVRRGAVNQMRPDSGKYDRLIRIWSRLPVPVTRLVGPLIVRGIP